jgi:hypothetical protein
LCFLPGEVFVETEHSFASRIRTLASNITIRNRLCIIVSPKIPTVNLNVPSQFRRLEIAASAQEPSLLGLVGAQSTKQLILEEGSKYCNIPFADWNARSTFLEYELLTGPGVAIDLPDQSMLSGDLQPPPFQLTHEEDVSDAAQVIEQQVIKGDPAQAPSQGASEALPWISGLTGAISGMGATGAFLVSSVKVSAYGLFVSAGPYSAGFNSVTASASLAVAGGAVGTGLAVGAAVTAAVYFIPWAKLASWLFDAFDRFVEFLKSIWNKVMQKMDFLKTILNAILRVVKAIGRGVMGIARSGASALSDLLKGTSVPKSELIKYS